MDWAPYVPVAERLANAKRKMAKLRKKGKKIQPIELEGRTIARSFWGKAWCDHVESFADYENRLPRGTRYVRNGSVCHLMITTGHVEAFVAGSELYTVSIDIEPLQTNEWNAIKAQCAGELGSVLELLQGTISQQVMDIVCDQDEGLFPTPDEISLSCSCPDGVSMCKHIAAVMYGVGHRLDHQPELLFLLRDVDPQELIDTDIVIDEVDTSSELDDDLGELFGIELDMDVEQTDDFSPQLTPQKTTPKTPKKANKRDSKQTSKKKMPKFIRGRGVRVREGVVDPDTPSFSLSGWQGRIVELHKSADETLIELAWDSQTLEEMPETYLEYSIDEGLDWTRIILLDEELIPCKVRDSKQDVKNAIEWIHDEWFE